MSAKQLCTFGALALLLSACGGAPTKVEDPAEAASKLEAVKKPTTKVGVSKAATAVFEKGVASLKETPPNYLDAVESFKAATADSPDYDIAWLNLAYCYEKLGRHADASAAYRALASRGVQDRGLTLALGCSLLKTGDTATAISSFEEALRENPEDLEARNNLSAAYIAKNDLDTALRYVKEVLAVQPKNVSAIVNLGLIYLRQDKLPLAELMFNKALGYEENHAQARNNLGIVYYKNSQIPAAVSSFEKAVSLDATLDEARLNVASVYLDYLDYATALPHFQAVRARFPNRYEAMIGEADCLYGTKDYEAAAALYEETLKIRPDNPEAVLRAGKLYEEQLSKPKEAMAHYNHYLKITNAPADHPLRSTVQFLEQMENMPMPSGSLEGSSEEPESDGAEATEEPSAQLDAINPVQTANLDFEYSTRLRNLAIFPAFARSSR